MMRKTLILFFLFYLLAGQYNLFSWEAEEFNQRFYKGEYLYDNGKYEEAIEEFRKVLEIYPDNTMASDFIKKAEQKLREEAILAKKEAAKEVIRRRIEVRKEKINRIKEERARDLNERRRKKEQARLNKKEQIAKAKEERLKLLAIKRAEKKAELMIKQEWLAKQRPQKEQARPK